MQSFINVPIKDINYLLKSNNLPLIGDKYLTAWNFLLTNPQVNIPVTIADYIIAYNIQKNNIPTTSLYINREYFISSLC